MTLAALPSDRSADRPGPAGAPAPAAAYGALATMPVFFGLSFAATKVALRGFNPFLLAASRFTCAGLILLLIWLLRGNRERLSRHDLRRLALLGLISLTVYFAFETTGIARTTASAASILIATIPIFVSVLSAMFLREHIVPGQWAGVLVSVAGVVALVVLGGEVEGGSLVGNLLVLAAAVSAAVYEIMARRLFVGPDPDPGGSEASGDAARGRLHSPLAVTAFQNLFGALFMAPLALGEALFAGVRRPTAEAGLGAAYLVLFCSVLAYLLLNYGLSHVQASKASTFTNLTPIVAVAGAFLILGERFTRWQAMAAVVVVIGVWLANRRQVAEKTVLGPEG